MRKKAIFKKVAAVTLASAMVVTSVMMPSGKGITVLANDTEPTGTTVTLPNPTYYYDFEGKTDAEKLQSKGLISGAATAAEIKGDGSIKSEESNGYFDNASAFDLVTPKTIAIPEAIKDGETVTNQAAIDEAKEKRRAVQQNYLNMPAEIINKIYYSENKAFTFSTKIKLVEGHYSDWSPLFVIDDGKLNPWPNLTLQFRGTATWNSAGWYGGDNSTKDTVLKAYSTTAWSTITYVVTQKSIKVYINGTLVQTIAGTESDEGCMKNFFNNGDTYFTTASRVSLGANQQVDWGDENAQVLYDDVAIYLDELTAEQVKELADNGVSSQLESVDIPESKLMVKGEKTTLTPAYTPVCAASDVTEIKFESSNTAAATVNETTGEVTAVAEGTADITVTVKTSYDNFTDTCRISVSDAIVNVDSVSASASFSTLYVGGASAKITSTYSPEEVTVDTTPSYKSSAEEILTVDDNGMVTGVGEGNASVTVTIDGKNTTVSFEVKNKTAVTGNWWKAFTTGYKVEDNSIVEFNLNVKGGDAAWNNFAAVFANVFTDGTVIPSATTVEGYVEYAVVRGDNWGWGGGDNKSKSGNEIKYSGGIADTTDADFIALMKSASVNIRIAKSGNTITYIYTATGENGQSVTRTATITEDTGDSLYVFFVPDTATIICDNIHTYKLDTSAEGYQAPTCTTEGEGTFNCTDTDCTESITSKIVPMGHNLTKHAGTPATCTTDGTKDYWTCARESGTLYADEACTTTIQETELTIPKLGHSMTHTVAKSATCTTDGNKEYWVCANESNDVYYKNAEGTEKISDGVIIAATGHNLGDKVEAKEATCTEAGNKAYYKCSKCENCYADADAKELIANITISKRDHTLGGTAKYEKESGGDLTKEQFDELKCTEKAYVTGTCSVCTTTMERTLVAGKKHTYEEVVKTKATPAEDGFKTLTCSACTDAIEGHAKEEEIKKASDITLAGTTYKCTGSAITPAVTVKDSEGKEIAVANYDVVYSDNIGVGTAKATINFKGDTYEGSAEREFTITPMDLPGSCIGYYGFNDTIANAAGGTAKTHVGGNGNIDAPAWLDTEPGQEKTYAEGKYGKAYVFSGDAATAHGDGLELDVTMPEAFTISYWVNPKTVSSATSMVFSPISTGAGLNIADNWFGKTFPTVRIWGIDGKEDAYLDNWINKDNRDEAEADALCNQWSHITLTCDGNGSLNLYINGESVATGSTAAGCLKDMPIYLGINFWDASFDGMMDELYIYNKALSAAEVASLYAYDPTAGGDIPGGTDTPHEPEYGVGVVTQKAANSEDGVITYTCTTCDGKTEGHTKTVAIKITIAGTSHVYTGAEIKPAVTVKDSAGKVIPAANYDVTYSNHKEVGTAKATIAFKGDYKGKVERTFTITKKQDDVQKPGDGDKTPAASLTLDKATVTLYTGKASKTATIKPTVTGTSKTVTWKTDKPKVATVKNGKITAVGKGTATITATANGISKTVKVTVKNPTLTIKKGSKKFTKSKLTVNKKKKVTLTVTVSPKNSGISIAKLTAKQKKIASVTLKSGKITIKGKKKGSFTLQIKSGKTTKKIKITVK